MDKISRQIYVDALNWLVENANFDIVLSDCNEKTYDAWVDDGFNYVKCMAYPDGDCEGYVYFSRAGIEVMRGASRICIRCDKDGSYVIKIPFTNLSRDYCAEECKIYNSAKKHGVNMFLAGCEFFENFYGAKIYCMERVETGSVYDSLWSKLSSSCNSEDEIEARVADAEDGDLFFDELRKYDYSDADNEKWDEFQEIFNIEDLHSGNIGMRNNKVVILDYAGWYK